MAPPNTRRLIAVLAGLVLVLGAGEIVIRQWLESPSRAIPDARFGWVLPPHARVVHSSEGYSVSTTNALGFFDDELRTPRPRLRALLLGDSYSEALQVPRKQNFSSVAERLVPGLEVVNSGLSGRSPGEYATTWNSRAHASSPTW